MKKNTFNHRVSQAQKIDFIPMDTADTTEHTTADSERASVSPLSFTTEQSVSKYLHELDSTLPHKLYDLVLGQVEQPLFEVVLKYTKGNKSNAAKLLGISRGTLRTKLRYYNLHK